MSFFGDGEPRGTTTSDERFLPRVRRALEVLGGSRPAGAEGGRPGVAQDLLFALWWLILLLAALAFAGRGTKFIYIDF